MASKSTRPFSASRPPPMDGHPLRNEILLGLSSKECKLILSKLILVDLKLHDPLQADGEKIDFIYFPNTAMASVLSSMEDGKSVEVGLVGKEGFVGLPVIAGLKTSPHEVVTQGQGTAFRVAAKEFSKTLNSCPGLLNALLRYSQEFLIQTTQVAACNRLHEGNERLARWLLMTHDRVGNDTLPLTQEFLAQMLGSRRASVSVSAITLQKAGLIGYSHGKMKILDREGLEKASCECYRVLQDRLKIWKRES